jgi:hypothetical protein
MEKNVENETRFAYPHPVDNFQENECFRGLDGCRYEKFQKMTRELFAHFDLLHESPIRWTLTVDLSARSGDSSSTATHLQSFDQSP